MVALVETYSFVNGKKSLIARERFDSTGELLSVQRFQNGSRHGQSLYLNQNGKDTLYILSFKKGLLHGKQTFFDAETGAPYTEIWNEGMLRTVYKWDVEEGGRVRVVLNWTADLIITDSVVLGKRKTQSIESYYGDTVRRSLTVFGKNSQYTMWYPDGKLKCMGPGYPYADERKGVWTIYRPDSGIYAKGIHQAADTIVRNTCDHYLFCRPFDSPLNNGLPEELEEYVEEAEFVEWDEITTFANGQWEHYDENGRLIRRYNGDDPHGCVEMFEYHGNGQLAEQYLSGCDTGWQVRWDDNGRLKYKDFQITRGINHFKENHYSSTGSIRIAGERKNGRMFGKWNFFDSPGRVVSVKHYDESEQGFIRFDSLQYYGNSDTLKSSSSRQFVSGSFYNGPEMVQYYRNGQLAQKAEFGQSYPVKLTDVNEWDSSGNKTGEMMNGVFVRNIHYVPDTDTARKKLLKTRYLYRFNDSFSIKIAQSSYFSANFPGTPTEIQQYYPTEITKSILRYNSKGQLDSLQESWYRNGKKKMIATFQNGILVEAVEYYPNGQEMAKISNSRLHEPSGQWVSESEIYFTASGKGIRHTCRATEESKQRYNASSNPNDLVYEVRDPRIISIMEDSDLEKIIDLNR